MYSMLLETAGLRNRQAWTSLRPLAVLAEKVKAQEKTMIHVVALLAGPPHLKLLETLHGKKLSGWMEEGVIKVSESRDVWEAIRFITFTVMAQPS